MGQISAAIQEAFQQMGIFQTANSRTPDGYRRSLAGRKHTTYRRWQRNFRPRANGFPFRKDDGVPPSPNDLGAVQKQLTSALAPEIQRHEVVLKANREGLVISLREIGFFDSGSAELRPASEAAVQRIAQVLSAQPNNIRIEGHTDNVPIHNAHFASNWELSTARATEMIRLFITRLQLPRHPPLRRRVRGVSPGGEQRRPSRAEPRTGGSISSCSPPPQEGWRPSQPR